VIIRVVLCLGLVFVAGVAAAEEPICSLYKVNTPMLNVSKDAEGDAYIDVLEKGEIACVTRQQKVDGRDRGFVPYKLESATKHTPVNGWATLRYMTALSAAEAAALGGAPAPPAPAPTPQPAPPAAADATPPAATDEDVLRYDQPIPFGPFPVNGRSIKAIAELGELVPLFAPIEGLDEAIWKKSCTACHKWNQARLCDQGKGYAKNVRSILRQPHPFGGAFKLAVMRWAKAGCQ
jgi:hypothetical protein